MVKRSKRKRSVKHYMKEYEYSQDTHSNVERDFQSPVRGENQAAHAPEEVPMQIDHENCKD